MEKLVDDHVVTPGRGRLVYDIGSLDIYGSYRGMLEGKGWCYKGVDIVKGANVDILVNEDYGSKAWRSLAQKPADLIVSGQCLEHSKNPFDLIRAVAGVAANGAFILLIAPASWPQHRHPRDCWRFLPDGMSELAKHAGCSYIGGGLSAAHRVSDKSCLMRKVTGVDCWAVLKKSMSATT
jgi:hypothetical protein